MQINFNKVLMENNVNTILLMEDFYQVRELLTTE